MYITITGADHYMGIESFEVGQKLFLKKDHDNHYDDEAIAVLSEKNLKLGYVANSVYTVARGTHSAGYIYNTFEEEIECRTLFIVGDKVIAEIIEYENPIRRK